MDGPNIKLITPADSQDLITLDDCKTMLGITDATGDAQLELLISQNSEAIALECNRSFGKAKIEETWRCVAPVCCPDGTCQIWLTLWPVKPTDIVSVESPKGTILDPLTYEVDELTGKLTLFNGCSSEISIVYTGGYDLPEEAPLPLQQVAGVMIRSFRTEAAAANTSGSGIRMLAHKESRVMYFSPKDMAGGGTPTSSGPTVQTSALKNMLSKYTRYAM